MEFSQNSHSQRDLADLSAFEPDDEPVYLSYCEPSITCFFSIDRPTSSVNLAQILRTNVGSNSCRGVPGVGIAQEPYFQLAPPSAARMLICTSRSRAHSLLRGKYYMIHRRHGRGYSTLCYPKLDRSRTRAVSSAPLHSHHTALFNIQMGEHTIIPTSYLTIITTSPLHRTYHRTTTPLAIFMPRTDNQRRLLLRNQLPQYQSIGRLNSITRT